MSWEVALGSKSKSPWKVALQAARHQPKYTDESVAKLVSEVDAKAELRGRKREVQDSAYGVGYQWHWGYTNDPTRYIDEGPRPDKEYDIGTIKTLTTKAMSRAKVDVSTRWLDDPIRALQQIPTGESVSFEVGPPPNDRMFTVTGSKVPLMKRK